MTNEQALQIVKRAEMEYDPHIRDGLTKLVGSITGWNYYESQHYEGENAWQTFHDGMGTIVDASSEEVAEMLAWKVDAVENLLFAVGRQPEPKEVVE